MFKFRLTSELGQLLSLRRGITFQPLKNSALFSSARFWVHKVRNVYGLIHDIPLDVLKRMRYICPNVRVILSNDLGSVGWELIAVLKYYPNNLEVIKNTRHLTQESHS
jgi:hypothetical protein